MYTYRQTLSAILIAVLAILVAWAVIQFAGLNLVRNAVDPLYLEESVTRRIIETFYWPSALRVLLVAGTAAATFTVLFTWWQSRSVIKAVAQVQAAATRIAGGDTDVRIEEPLFRLGYEFEALGTVFNFMADSLSKIESTRARLLGDLAHEMRTPLSTLDAYLEAIGDGFEQADPETIELLRHQTARLSRLAADISLVARVEEGQVDLHRQPLLITQLVREACRGIESHYAEDGINLSWEAEVGADGIRIDGDPDRLGQVLTNLLTNARRHTPAGGSVKVTVSHPQPRWVSVTVRDTGEGIPAEHLPHLFERFYRVDSARDRRHGGSGIGLTIVKAMTIAHGGSVTVSSDGLGHGSAFTITLPVLSTEATTPDQSPPLRRSAARVRELEARDPGLPQAR
jgi:signal transduction histidine kinase